MTQKEDRALAEFMEYTHNFDMTDDMFRRWQHQGIECGIAARAHTINGYIQIPEVLKGRWQWHAEIKGIIVHGGLAYGPDVMSWVGFDTGHFELGDRWERAEVEQYLSGLILHHFMLMWEGGFTPRRSQDKPAWTVERVVAETNRLAEQFATLAATAPPQQPAEAGRSYTLDEAAAFPGGIEVMSGGTITGPYFSDLDEDDAEDT